MLTEIQKNPEKGRQITLRRLDSEDGLGPGRIVLKEGSVGGLLGGDSDSD